MIPAGERRKTRALRAVRGDPGVLSRHRND